MKKKILLLCVYVLLFGVCCVGTTFALLTSKSRQLDNTFVYDDITLSLTETTGSTYTLIPGSVVDKDPRITVGKNSVQCWLFVKLERDDTFDAMVDYDLAAGWTPLEGEDGVYWRKVEQTIMDKTYGVLQGNRVVVSSTVTEAQLASLEHSEKLTFSAYAIQCEGISTPQTAWEFVKSGGNEL